MPNMILMYRDELGEEHYLAEFHVPNEINGIPFEEEVLWSWQAKVEENYPLNEECQGYVWEDRRMWSSWINRGLNDWTFDPPFDY